MSHPDRGTWFHQRYGRWYELDGFLIQQEQRHQIVKKMRTVKENSFSDHRPKGLITRTVIRPRIVITGNKKLSISHIVLKEPEKTKEYKERTEKAMEKIVKEGKVQNWYNLSKLMTNEAANVVGRMPKRRQSPWLEGHEEEAQGEHKRITELTSELLSLIEASKRCLTEEEKQQKILLIKEKREEKRRSRKTFRKKLRRWERTWWKQIICQCQKGRTRKGFREDVPVIEKAWKKRFKDGIRKGIFHPIGIQIAFRKSIKR